MAQHNQNETAFDDTSSVMECPDTLQDLCVFYLMNNLDVLVPSLNKVQEKNEDFSSSFSLLLGKKMLDYFNKYCLPCVHERPYIGQLMKIFQQCDEICITSTKLSTYGNIQTLADSCKLVKGLHLTCFDDHSQTQAFRTLLQNNLPHLTAVKLSQKCEEDLTFGYLNLLAGKVYDAGFSEEEEEDDDDDDGDNDDDDDGDKATSGYVKRTEDDIVEKIVLQVGNFNDVAVKDIGTAETEEKKSATVVSDKVVPDLKSFTYLQIYTMVHPNLEPCRSFGWFYDLISRVISRNNNLQSFTFVTLISNPIEWFLSQPDLPLLKDLQSLCLSFQYLAIYAADSEEMKMPYTDKFFKNLPILQNLRHLDISCSISDEDFDLDDGLSSKFTYPQEQVEMFVEAVKELPLLKSLDISGTNLAEIICHKDKGDERCRDHCMPGFEGRRFDFLGLYGTDACTHKFIPADRVSGNASIEQLLEALKTLQHNLMIMSAVINEIYGCITENSHMVDKTVGLTLIDGLITFMTRVGEWNGSYSEAEDSEEGSVLTALEIIDHLVVNQDPGSWITVRRKRMLLEQLLTICHNVSSEGRITKQRATIFEKSMLLITHLGLEHTAMYSYKFKQYIKVLMGILNRGTTGDMGVQSYSAGLLYSAFENHIEFKAVAGTKMELITELLKVGKDRFMEDANEDEIMQKVWDIIWTLTGIFEPRLAKTYLKMKFLVTVKCLFIMKGVRYPVSLLRFVASWTGVLHKDNACFLQKYPVDKYLHRGITGVLVNVSRNPHLIPFLVTSDIVTMLRQLLSYGSEKDFCVSFNSASFLIMLASQGPEAWTLADPSRDAILADVDQVMHKWNMLVDIPKVYKLRSLTTILSQLDNYSTPVAQYWAAWLICNIVSAKPYRYCNILESEDGLSKIDSVLEHGGLTDDLVALLEKIKMETMKYMSDKQKLKQP